MATASGDLKPGQPQTPPVWPPAGRTVAGKPKGPDLRWSLLPHLLHSQGQRASLNVCLTIFPANGLHWAVTAHTTQTLFPGTSGLSSRRNISKSPSSQPVGTDNGERVAASAG